VRILRRQFYERIPEVVARDLLGKRLVRKLRERILEGFIVETEAYHGLEDPASRAYRGLKTYNRSMWGEPGRVFIYNVHRYWMFNVVAHKPGTIGAVLIRAIQPTRGIETMKRNRNVKDMLELTNGPGKLTKALRIDKSLNEASLTMRDGEISIVHNDMKPQIERSHRIGVKRDLEKKLRFFIEGNNFVSR
jgi:DNA-3-methyladenine glycosylase